MSAQILVPFEEVALRIEGLHTQRHAQLMYGLVKWLGVKSALEVGPYKGASSVWIAKAIQENGGGVLYLVDDFSLRPETEGELVENLTRCGVLDVCQIAKANSQLVESFPECEFAFVDGDHSLDGCLADCAKAVLAGARCLCVHDTHSWWGPREFVELVRKGGKGWSMDEWDVLEANHDEGFAVLLRRQSKPAVRFGREEFPLGRV